MLQVYVEEYNAGIMSINNLEEGSERLRSQYVVFVDAGHGGSDPGAVANGVKEKDINLSVALKVRSKLQDLGVQVVMNRDKDIFVNYTVGFLIVSIIVFIINKIIQKRKTK